MAKTHTKRVDNSGCVQAGIRPKSRLLKTGRKPKKQLYLLNGDTKKKLGKR